MSALSVQDVGKAFRAYGSEWHRFARWLGISVMPKEETWVLRGVSFEVEPGEAVGIVGQNGAGKSTLLKIIAGTMQATEGRVRVGGGVAAILELGMGFNPELTGRQNVRHTAGLMGLEPREIAAAMADIERFADIGEYFDQPVRTYSSGMQMRVAFAVATAWRPAILIVDEALSVGDAAFQRKCFRRLEDYVAAGTALLFVSHDIETVKKLCERALFIREGRLVRRGPAKQICDEYERELFGDRAASDGREANAGRGLPLESARWDPSLHSGCETSYGNGKAHIESCWLADSRGQRINVLPSGAPFQWCFRVRFTEDVHEPVYAMMVKTREGVALYGTDSALLGAAANPVRAGDTVVVQFSLKNPLAPGTYYFNCGVRSSPSRAIEFLARRIDSGVLRVTASQRSTAAVGMLEMGATLSVGQTVEVDAI